VIDTGQCECFGFAYLLDNRDLNPALDYAENVTVFAKGVDITGRSGFTYCFSNTSLVQIFGPTSYQWTWSPPTGLSDTVGDSIMFFPNVTTDYTAIGIGPCGNDTIHLHIPVDTSLLNAYLTVDDTLICRGTATNLRCFGGQQWSWSPTTFLAHSDSNVASAFSSATTNYSCVISTLTGCKKTQTIRLRVDSVSVNAGRDTSVCPGKRVKLRWCTHH
jgi:hypothetical protein